MHCLDIPIIWWAKSLSTPLFTRQETFRWYDHRFAIYIRVLRFPLLGITTEIELCGGGRTKKGCIWICLAVKLCIAVGTVFMALQLHWKEMDLNFIGSACSPGNESFFKEVHSQLYSDPLFILTFWSIKHVLVSIFTHQPTDGVAPWKRLKKSFETDNI